MSEPNGVKPYLARIKDWKIKNIVMLYLEARDKFVSNREMLGQGTSLSFEGMREICDILYEIKEDHHLIFKKLIDPNKNKFEEEHKFMPCEIETQFMNNIGLLFHKVMVTRELKYLTEHYVEQDEAFQQTRDDLQYNLKIIDTLFDDGIEIIKNLIPLYKDNTLLLSLLLDDPPLTQKYLGEDAADLLKNFIVGKGLDEIYFSVGRYYTDNGWSKKAKRMFKQALKHNPKHKLAQKELKAKK